MSKYDDLSLSYSEKFWSFVKKSDGCWVWTGSTADGYGRFQAAGLNFSAHRISYTWIKGKIPDGLQIDHLCRVRRCVNPDHLEPVTSQINTLRGASMAAIVRRTNRCKRGHDLSDDGAYIRESGYRECKECNRMNARNRARRYAAQKKQREMGTESRHANFSTR